MEGTKKAAGEAARTVYSSFSIRPNRGKFSAEEELRLRNALLSEGYKIERERELQNMHSKAGFDQYVFRRELFFIKACLSGIVIMICYLICNI